MRRPDIFRAICVASALSIAYPTPLLADASDDGNAFGGAFMQSGAPAQPPGYAEHAENGGTVAATSRAVSAGIANYAQQAETALEAQVADEVNTTSVVDPSGDALALRSALFTDDDVPEYDCPVPVSGSGPIIQWQVYGGSCQFQQTEPLNAGMTIVVYDNHDQFSGSLAPVGSGAANKTQGSIRLQCACPDGSVSCPGQGELDVVEAFDDYLRVSGDNNPDGRLRGARAWEFNGGIARPHYSSPSTDPYELTAAPVTEHYGSTGAEPACGFYAVHSAGGDMVSTAADPSSDAYKKARETLDVMYSRLLGRDVDFTTDEGAQFWADLIAGYVHQAENGGERYYSNFTIVGMFLAGVARSPEYNAAFDPEEVDGDTGGIEPSAVADIVSWGEPEPGDTETLLYYDDAEDVWKQRSPENLNEVTTITDGDKLGFEFMNATKYSVFSYDELNFGLGNLKPKAYGEDPDLLAWPDTCVAGRQPYPADPDSGCYRP